MAVQEMVGRTFAMPWGLDEVEVFVLDIYRSYDGSRAVVEIPEDLGGGTLGGLRLELLQLLPAKPAGLYWSEYRRREGW